MTDLATWFAAQLDADEQAAHAATPGPWAADEPYPAAGSVSSVAPTPPHPEEEWEEHYQRSIANESAAGDLRLPDAEHIARHDPAFVLADITAKRRILAEHATQDVPVLKFRGELIMSGPECRVCADWDAADMDGPPNAPAPCQTLRLLAAPYASRPGYDTSWAPEQPAHNPAGDST